MKFKHQGFDTVSKFLDQDIIDSFHEEREDSDGKKYESTYFVSQADLTAVIIQLTRAINGLRK